LVLVTTAILETLAVDCHRMKPNDMKLEQLCELFAYTPKGRPLDSKEVAALLRVHEQTVREWRFRGEGPTYFQPAGSSRVWYAELAVLRWLASGAKQSTSETVAA
jgi:hypothetical protein